MSNKFEKLFISHASKDETLVGNFMTLIERTLEVPHKSNGDSKIRCSTIDEFKFSFGTDLNEQVRDEISGSYFICILTPRSIKSTWVLFELGAAWGAKIPIIPVIYGLNFSELPDQIRNVVGARLENKEDVLKLIDQVGTELGWNRKGNERINNSVDEFCSSLTTVSYLESKLLFRSEIIQELPWNKVVSKTKKELYVWAWSGTNAMNSRTRNVFLELINKGIYVKMLILNPDSYSAASEAMVMSPICAWSNQTVKNDIANSRNFLINDFIGSLKDHQKEYFILKETSWLITWSGLAIDPESETGLLQIENYLYNYSQEFSPEIPITDHLSYRPNLLLDKSSKFFQPYYLSFKNLWKSADIVS